MGRPKIVPELYCSDIHLSLKFYVDVLGFHVRYERPEERFAYLEREGAELMIEQTVDRIRTFLAAVAEYPFGRGMHIQIETADVEVVYARALEAECRIFLPLEDRWYRIDDSEEGNRQCVLMDPDGYLLRLWTALGQRDAQTNSGDSARNG